MSSQDRHGIVVAGVAVNDDLAWHLGLLTTHASGAEWCGRVLDGRHRMRPVRSLRTEEAAKRAARRARPATLPCRPEAGSLRAGEPKAAQVLAAFHKNKPVSAR